MAPKLRRGRSQSPATKKVLYDCSKILKKTSNAAEPASSSKKLDKQRESSKKPAPRAKSRTDSATRFRIRKSRPSPSFIDSASSIHSSSDSPYETFTTPEPRRREPPVRQQPKSVAVKGAASPRGRYWKTCFVAGCLLIAALWWHPTLWEPLIFCDGRDDEPRHCTPCPRFGTCVGGKVTCDAGYEHQGTFCVKDRRIGVRAALWTQRLDDHLAYLNGLAQCYPNQPGSLDVKDVRLYLADQFGGTYLDETFEYMQSNFPSTLRQTGTIFESTRVVIPMARRIQQTFWSVVPQLFALLSAIFLLRWRYNVHQGSQVAYSLIKEYIERETQHTPRVTGPTALEIIEFAASSLGLNEKDVRAILMKIRKQERLIVIGPDVFRGNAEVFWSQPHARGASMPHLRSRAPKLS